MKLNVLLFFVFASAPGVLAQTPTFNQFALPAELSQPYHIAKGPDRAVWFTSLASNAIGRLTTTGETRTFPLPPQTLPSDITTGPDGALWFNEVAGVGRLTPAGALTRYLIRGQPTGITSGPDGALWFPVFAGSVGTLTTSGVTTLYPVPNLESSPQSIALGPDGALWFTEGALSRIGRITTSGVLTEYAVPVRPSQEPWPYGIIAGPDGAMWFTNLYSNRIGRIEMGGSITIHPVGAENPGGNGEIVAGPDGALWFTDTYGSLGRITVSGSSTLYPAASTSPLPRALTVGPDNNLWFPTDANTITQAVLSPTSCTVVPTYSNGTLTVNYYLRTPEPLQWTGVVKSSTGVVTHWSTPIAATAAYRTGALQFPGIAPAGFLSVVSSFTTATGTACEDKERVNTGAAVL